MTNGIRIRSQLVLSHLLKFHKKESNLLWWAYFDRKNVSETFELKNEPESIYNAKLISSEKALNKNNKKQVQHCTNINLKQLKIPN